MTAHITAKKGEIAKKVIMPGDPLRAKLIAEKYLSNPKIVSQVRGNNIYTGTYKEVPITIMSSGMGCPSMGIYSYELFKFYEVEEIIRVGSCGSYVKELNLFDLVLAEKSYSESTYAQVQNGYNDKVIFSSSFLNEKILKVSSNIKVATVHCSDVFYKENNDYSMLVDNKNCLVVEMETFALFHNANLLNKHASAILTVSDSLVTKEETTPQERERSFLEMIELSLEAIIND
jgi:purine-nucleoside phosphorylase